MNNIVENSPDIIARFDTKNRLVFINNTFEKITGLSRKDLIGNTTLEISISPKSAWQEFLGTILSTQKETIEQFQLKGVARWIYYQFIGRPEFDENGKVKSYMVVGRDITIFRQREEVSIENERQLLTKLNTIVNEERKRLSFQLHDELGQNLSAIAFLIESFRQRFTIHSEASTKLEEIDTIIDLVHNQTIMMAHMLNPIESDSNSLKPALRVMLNHIEKIYKVKCRLTIYENIPVLDKIIVENVFNIIREAVNNSVKHGSPNIIDVEIKLKDNQVEVIVSDDDVDFVENSSKDGMGLNIMKYRANILGGDLSIKRELNTGFTVNLIFPLAVFSTKDGESKTVLQR